MNQITVFEKYSRYWPATALTSLIAAGLLTGAWFYTEDVLLEGYFRLGAFCLFTLSLLSFFKIKNGQMQIDFKLNGQHDLEISYRARGNQIAQDHLDLTVVKAVEVHNMPDRSIYDDFKTGDHAVRYKKKKGEEWLYLTEVHGRIIALDKENAGEIAGFLGKLIEDLNRSA